MASLAQQNPRLAAAIDSLYQADQDVQWTAKAMNQRHAPDDSLKRQDSLQRQTFKRGLEMARQIYTSYGYPTAKLVGTDASHHFFVLIQHADADPAFQAEMLPILNKLSQRKEISRKDYAFLYDRVQRNTGDKQLYGTQLTYNKKGSFFDDNNNIMYPPDLADPAHVDERRKAMGLEPIEQYYEMVLQMLGRPRKKN